MDLERQLLELGKRFLLARDLRWKARYGEAVALYQKVLDGLGSVGLGETVDAALCLRELGITHLSSAQYDEAILELAAALRCLERSVAGTGFLPGAEVNGIVSVCRSYLEALELGDRGILGVLREDARYRP